MRTKMITILMACVCMPLARSGAQQVQVIKLGDLMEIMERPSDKVVVINFWATWCKPCIMEMPFFQQLDSLKKTDLDLHLVSLDFREDLDKKLVGFVQRRNLRGRVYLLDETNYDRMINTVDPNWGGALPTTIVLAPDRKKRLIAEREFHSYEDLYSFISQINN